MKKILATIAIGLLCSLPSLYADDDYYANPNHQIDKMVRKFQERGGSQDGVAILKEELGKIDKQSLIDNNSKMMTLKMDLRTIATAPTFDATAFKNKITELHQMVAERMTKMVDAQVAVLSRLNQHDREIYIRKIYEKMSKMHGKMDDIDEYDD